MVVFAYLFMYPVGYAHNTVMFGYSTHHRCFLSIAVLLHQSWLKTQSKHNATTLSEHVHKLNRENVEYDIDWKIIDKAKSYDGRKCDLCLTEKTRIMYSKADQPKKEPPDGSTSK